MRRGRRGAGSITRRDGKYQARWSSTEGGKRVRKSATFHLRNDAEWWLREASRGDVPETGRTVEDYLLLWLRGKRRIRPSTRLQYANHIEKHIIPVLGGFRMTDLQRRHVEAFVEDRLRYVSPSTHRPLTPSTVGKLLVTLRSALEEAVPREIPDNPAAKVEAPKVEREPVRAVGATEASAIIDAVAGTWVEPIARFLFGSALRISEALTLNQGDIDWREGVVKLRRSKTSIRTVMVSDDGMAALRMAVDDAPRSGKGEPVFFGPKPSRTSLVRDRMTRHSVAHALPRLIEAAGIERLTAHGLRHAHATVGLEAGTPIEAIADQLGHRSPNMTRRYAHVLPTMKRAALQAHDNAVKDRQAR